MFQMRDQDVALTEVPEIEATELQDLDLDCQSGLEQAMFNTNPNDNAHHAHE